MVSAHEDSQSPALTSTETSIFHCRPDYHSPFPAVVERRRVEAYQPAGLCVLLIHITRRHKSAYSTHARQPEGASLILLTQVVVVTSIYLENNPRINRTPANHSSRSFAVWHITLHRTSRLVAHPANSPHLQGTMRCAGFHQTLDVRDPLHVPSSFRFMYEEKGLEHCMKPPTFLVLWIGRVNCDPTWSALCAGAQTLIL